MNGLNLFTNLQVKLKKTSEESFVRIDWRFNINHESK